MISRFVEKYSAFDALATALMVVFKIFLDISYVFLLQPVFAYSGFVLEYSPETIATGYMMALSVLAVVPKRIRRPSDFMLIMLFLLMFIPLTTMYSFGGVSLLFAFFNMLFWLVANTLTQLAPRIQGISLPASWFKPIFVAVYLLFFAYVALTAVLYMGFSPSSLLLGLSKVYSQRAVYKSAAVPLAGYLYPWASNVVFPSAFSWFLINRKYLPAGLTVIIQLVLYSVTGQKSTLFALLLAFLVCILLRFKRPAVWLMVGAVTMVAGFSLLYWVFKEILPFSLFVRRLMILPAHIADQYYRFFSQNGYVYLSHSTFSGLLQYPYSLEPADLMGSLYYIAGETHANSGIVTDGFINFGYWGIMIWSVFLSLVLKLADWVSDGKRLSLCTACFAGFVITFSNTALFTSMVTHGFLVVLLMVSLFPKEDTAGGGVYAPGRTRHGSLPAVGELP